MVLLWRRCSQQQQKSRKLIPWISTKQFWNSCQWLIVSHFFFTTQNHQLDLSRKLQKVQDIQSIINDIHDDHPSREGETTSSLASLLQARMETLKRDLTDKQELLKMRRNTEQLAEDYQSDVQRLQEWFASHQGMSVERGQDLPANVGSESLQRQMDLQQVSFVLKY